MNNSNRLKTAQWALGTWILRIAVALCFIGHGAFGIITKAGWVPYFGVAGISADRAWQLMPVVGSFDILLGLLALAWPRPSAWFWAWLTVWTVWTALLRPLSGEPVWEAVERAGNYSVPLTLLFLARGIQWEKAAWVLRGGSVLLLLGHGLLALGGKSTLVTHWHSLFASADALVLTRCAGAVELTLAFFILLQPNATLSFAAFGWKVVTEALFLVAGAPFWEWVERGGSYGTTLVLGLWLTRQHFATPQIPSVKTNSESNDLELSSFESAV